MPAKAPAKVTSTKRPIWRWILLVIVAVCAILLFNSMLIIFLVPFFLLFGSMVAATRSQSSYQRKLWVSISVLQAISLTTGSIAWWLWGIAFELADSGQSTTQIDSIWQPIIIISGISFVISLIFAVTSLILRRKSTTKHRI